MGSLKALVHMMLIFMFLYHLSMWSKGNLDPEKIVDFPNFIKGVTTRMF